MLKQVFSEKELIRLVDRSDVWRRDLWNNEVERANKIRELALAISNEHYTISALRCNNANGKQVYMLSSDADWLSLRKVDRDIRRVYKIKPADRNNIIKQIKVLLSDKGKLVVTKADLSSFYERIDFGALIGKLKEDGIIGLKSIKIIDALRGQVEIASGGSNKGLPRGVGLSVTLAELAARRIDQAIKSLPSVYYYARYVDDIVVVSEDFGRGFLKDIKSAIAGCGFLMNEKKEKSFSIRFCELQRKPVEVLGYRLVEEPSKKEGKSKKKDDSAECAGRGIEVKIARPKLNKIKTKISRSFISYAKDGRFDVLLARIKYLTMNVLIRKSKNGMLFGGNAYNYCQLTTSAQMIELDSYLHSVIKGRGRIGKLIKGKLNEQQNQKISRLSFKQGFEEKFHVRFSKANLSEITKVF